MYAFLQQIQTNPCKYFAARGSIPRRNFVYDMLFPNEAVIPGLCVQTIRVIVFMLCCECKRTMERIVHTLAGTPLQLHSKIAYRKRNSSEKWFLKLQSKLTHFNKSLMHHCTSHAPNVRCVHLYIFLILQNVRSHQIRLWLLRIYSGTFIPFISNEMFQILYERCVSIECDACDIVIYILLMSMWSEPEPE